jgi:CHAT domain
VARCQVLISAGLFREAYRLAVGVADARRLAGDGNHLRNALIVAARAALLADRAEEAVAAAEEALSLLESTSGFGTDLEVRHTLVEARHRISGGSSELLGEIVEIADRLEERGLMVASSEARLLGARIALDLDDHEVATRLLTEAAKVAHGPPELLLQSRLARARLAVIDGDLRRAASAVRSGLRLLDRYQSTLAATDLRLGIERQSEELGEMAVDLAVTSRRPRRILLTLDRTRARGLRFRPVVPAGDDTTRAMLEELRQVASALENPDSDHVAELLSRRRRLQDAIAATERVRRRSGEGNESSGIGDLFDSLGDRSLLELGFHDGRLIAVHLKRRRARLVELGHRADIGQELRRARFAMRRAARLGRSLDPSTLERLDDLLLGGVRFQSEDVIVVPPPSLIAAPWAGLPTLAGHAISVTPSAEMWWRASRTPPSKRRSVVVAAGPGLAMAESEMAMISNLYPEAETLGVGSTVEMVRAAMGRATMAHIACHATFSTENPMFSSLRLGDGDLNVYDLERLDAAPSLVVLSACDSGYTETEAGDELAGLTSALLSLGTRTVVASVGLVPDSPATPSLMERFHRGLIAGAAPPQALARAQSEVAGDPAGFAAAASFICVGA